MPFVYELPLSITVDDDDLKVGELKARGRGIDPTDISIDDDSYRDQLKRVLESLQLVWFPGDPGDPSNDAKAPGKAGVDDDHNGTVDDPSEYGTPNSGDKQLVIYRYGTANPFAPNPTQKICLVSLAPPGACAGPSPPQFLVFNPLGAFGSLPGIKFFRTYEIVGEQFRSEFTGFMPYEKDAGPDGISGTTDDEFSPGTMVALDALVEVKKVEIFDAVQADFGPVDNGKDAFRVVGSDTGDITIKWRDAFSIDAIRTDSGTYATGKPIYGFADKLDADLVLPTEKSIQIHGKQDGNGDGFSLNTLLHDPKGPKTGFLPDVAKAWAIAEEFNPTVTQVATFGLGINLSNTSELTFAQFVANTVSHELGHTFGLLDAYLKKLGTVGSAGCIGSRCIPFDIMMNGGDDDPDLYFKESNLVLLRGAMGIATETDLLGALPILQRTFNLPLSSEGIRDDLSEDNEFGVPITPPPTPEIAVSVGNSFWIGDAADKTLDFGEAAADGLQGDLRTVTIDVSNVGRSRLSISTIKLLSGDGSFSVIDSDGIQGSFIEHDQTRQLVVRFDPVVVGKHTDELEIETDAATTPVLRIPLSGKSFSQSPSVGAQLLRSNNLGGAPVGGSAVVASEIFELTNVGQQALVINDITFPEGQGAFRLLGVPANLPLQPIMLARGETFTFGARFDPQKLGLTRSLIDVHSNDPTQPTLRLSVTGTGLARVPNAKWGQDYVSLATPDQENAAPLRTRSNDKGDFSLFVPSDQLYDLTIFDPDTGMVGEEGGITSPSGQFTKLGSTIVFGASQASDSDYDGLPDDIEQTIGTSIHRTDSDGNGLDDFSEVTQGLDPLGGRPVATGVVAQLPLTGTAKKIVVEGATATNQAELAYIATGSGGLAIVDISQFAKPVLLSELDLPGDATDVSVDSVRGIAAVATGQNGLAVIDVSQPTAPKLIRTISIPTTDVEVSGGIGYVADGSFVTSVDLDNGSVLDHVYLGAEIGGLAREGSFLYATNTTNVLTILDLSQSFLTRRGQILISTSADDHHDGALFVGGGIAYVMNTLDAISISGQAGGFATVDVSDPDLPKLISNVDRAAANQPFAAVAASGSGLALLAGAPLTTGAGDRNPRLDLLDVSDPTNTYKLLRSIQLPSAPFDVLTAGGAAFVADGAGGLSVVNYLPFDVDGQAPDLTIPPDPLTGTVRQVYEGETIRLPIQVSDDVQVRSVELLTADYVDALNIENNKFTLAASDISFPFDIEIPAPLILPGKDYRITLVRVRVTDTGGNVTTSAPVFVTSNRDYRPPFYFSHGFVDGSFRAVGLDSLSLFFSEPLRRDTVSATTFQVLDAQGQLVPGFIAESIGGGAIVRLGFNALAAGDYRLQIDGPNVKDRSGLSLIGSPIVTRFTVVQGTENIWRGPPNSPIWTVGNWDDAQSWSLGRVPGPSDLVTMGLADNQTVNFTSGIISVRALAVTGGTLSLNGGTLAVNDGGQVATLLINGGRLDGTGDLTITKHFSLTNGFLTGTGQLHIAAGAIGELSAATFPRKLDGRPITVDGQLVGLDGGFPFYYVNAPVIEIRKGGTFTAANGFSMLSVDGLAGRLDLFGRFTTVAGAKIQLGLEINVLPGGEFAPSAGRVELQGGGQFNAPLNLASNTILHLRGPLDASKPKPRYVLPSGITHQINGPLLVGGADVIVGGNANVRLMDFAVDGYGTSVNRNGVVTIDGLLTITERLGAGTPAIFGGSVVSFGFGGFEGKGELLIPGGATYNPFRQTFRGITIVNRGTIDFTLSTQGFNLGAGSVFEHEGEIIGYESSDGSFDYGDIDPASTPDSVNEPLDYGTFNARVPLEIKGRMRFFVPLNVYAGLTVSNAAPVVPGNYNFAFELGGGGTFHGPINVALGVHFELHYDVLANGNDPRRFANVLTFAADSQVKIDGDFLVINNSLVVNSNATIGFLWFNAPDGNNNYTNSISGPGNIDVTRQFNWQVGRIATTGVLTIQPSARVQIDASSTNGTVLDGTLLVNQSADPLSYANGQLVMEHAALVRNEGMLIWHLYYGNIESGDGTERIDNFGNWTFSNNGFDNAAVLVNVPFLNDGTLRIDNCCSGRLAFSDLTNNGTLVIDPHVPIIYGKRVEVQGTYRQAAAATLRVEISNTRPFDNPQFYMGTLDVDGAAFLAGKLEIDFVQFAPNCATSPTAGDPYGLLSFASQTGDFSQIVDLDPDDGIAYQVTTTATGIMALTAPEAQGLRAEGQALIARPDQRVADVQLAAIQSAAIARWAANDLDCATLARLQAAEIHFADLSDNLLGMAGDNSISIDRDAAGWGWFVDSTPNDDDEFELIAGDVLQARSSSTADGRMDLLTVILHELGHLAGFQHVTDGSTLDLMDETLAAGSRRRPRVFQAVTERD